MGFGYMFKEVDLLVVTLTLITTSVAAQPLTKPGCQSRCGNLSIPYPFGIGNDCNISREFFITCDTTLNPPKAFLMTGSIEVLHISLDGYLRISSSFFIGSDCYNSSGRIQEFNIELNFEPFAISHTRNKFTAIGCDTIAYMDSTAYGLNYSTGCLTFCSDLADVINGSCTGIGSCQSAIPKGLLGFFFKFDSRSNLSNVLSFNPCSYGFVVEDGTYIFSVSDLSNTNFSRKKFPIILDWTIGNQTCREAEMDPKTYACKQNSTCIDAENGPGYLCKCLDGFKGNPYLAYGCQYINECETLNPCNGAGICHNTPGSYSCSCPEGFNGDGWKNGTGCSLKPHLHRKRFPNTLDVSLGTGISLLSFLLCSSWVCLWIRQRKISKLKQQNFLQNGGNLLREQLTQREECSETTKIFTVEELKKATNNYHESRFLGRGGQGTVHKGILPNGRSVAIKKSIIGDQKPSSTVH